MFRATPGEIRCWLRAMSNMPTLITMRDDFFRLPRPRERGLRPSAKGLGWVRTRLNYPVAHCSACFSGVSRWKCIISSGARREAQPLNPTSITTVSSISVWLWTKIGHFGELIRRNPECFTMREISPRMRETRDVSSNTGTWHVPSPRLGLGFG